MEQPWIAFHDLSFSYDTARNPLIEGLTVHFPVGWTGIVGANGSGKTTLLKLATGMLQPQGGYVHIPEEVIYCPQRTDEIPALFNDFVASTEGYACEIKGKLNIVDEWLKRWNALSHGERKRAQIAVMLWRRPQVLAVDEPTNHLDSDALTLLAQALQSFHGVGLLVSHDRELLDSLCTQCLFMDPPTMTMRTGGVTQGLQQTKREQEYMRKERETAKSVYKRLKKEAIRRQEDASRSNRRRSKRGLHRKDHDARAKINMARVSGKDGVGGKLLRQIDGRLKQAYERMDAIHVKKTYEMGIWLPGSYSKRDIILKLPPGSISLGGDRWLEFPELVIRPNDRIALTGANGAGKSTLIRQIVHSLKIPEERLTYVPQEINVQSSKDIMKNIRSLDRERLGQMMTVVSRLGSRPYRLLDSIEPSPGEMRKILLAMGIACEPHLIIMDEPTNHMDLPSIECLEEALVDCPCGLLLVSHDMRFLKHLTSIRWNIEDLKKIPEDSDKEGHYEQRIQYRLRILLY